jgi:hypothetical protein
MTEIIVALIVGAAISGGLLAALAIHSYRHADRRYKARRMTRDLVATRLIMEGKE